MTKRKWAVLLILTLLLTTSGCTPDTAYSGTLNVVEASQVGTVYTDNPEVIVIDARGEEAYAKGHLKGAIDLAPSELVDEKSMLIDQVLFEKVVGAKGISSEKTIYIYDDNDGVNSSRILWSFRVYGHENIMVVNGGASALVKAGLEITKEKPSLEAAVYTVKEANPSLMASYDEMKLQVEQPSDTVKIVDVRSIAEYQAGYIKGAILYPHTKNLYSDGSFMSSRDIKLFYQDLGLKKEDTILLYCKSSFRATQTFVLLEEAGFTNVKVYDGAWLEWSSKTDVTVPAEEKAPITQQDGS
ncbi:sulfurtransferase [Fusibacter sp. 3D3]|uniref:sulfurtransferase n=1 Tax=Fusibacter sp. 3D3 TaxID=1048380 RepID=UPI0008535C37|nr:rhodanese-like domain-containing protein [Fusibacter sp. 3D3]GAU78272.1 thiosulfate sulfurtransferase [Fusibacter sp. 3D3]